MNAVQDWHADWIMGLLGALVALGVIGVALLGSILGELRKWREDYWRERREYPLGGGGSNRVP